MEKLADGSLDHSMFAQTYGIEPRMDLLETMPAEIGALESYRKKDDASKVRAQVRDHLLDQGYVLDPANGNETYTIYIINLIDESAPDPAPGKWVYVGETSKTPEERFDEHKNGIRDNKAAREYGRDLNSARLDALWQVAYGAVEAGDLGQVGNCLRIEKRRAELWGLDQPRTHHVQVEPPAFDTRPGDMLIKKLEELRERQGPLPEASAV